MNPTADNKNRVAQTKSKLFKCWKKCAETEEGTIMLKCLLESDIGTNDLENFLNKQQGCRKSKGKGGGSRAGNKDKVKGIRFLMQCKITDNIQLETELRKERAKLRKALETLMGGKNMKGMRNFVTKTKKYVVRHRESVRKKYHDKIKHLSMKNAKKEKCDILPETLNRYSASAVFQEECLMAAEELSGPVIVEDCDDDKLSLNEDEVEVLMKGPKFSVYRSCDRETFLECMEAAFA
jgi:hypothetical protein